VGHVVGVIPCAALRLFRTRIHSDTVDHQSTVGSRFRDAAGSGARDGRGALKVAFQDAEGKPNGSAYAMVRPAPETAPYFRFRSPDVTE
jgi:hypothetical protein